jgi:hypothetical protein
MTKISLKRRWHWSRWQFMVRSSGIVLCLNTMCHRLPPFPRPRDQVTHGVTQSHTLGQPLHVIQCLK